MKKLQFGLLLLVLALGFILRLYRFDNPIADWHSWRQSDTSSVSRNFVKNGFDMLHPRYDDISNIQTGMDNPQGYRFVEFPIFNLFQAGFYKIAPIFTLEQWGRLVSILSWFFSSIFIYLLVKKYSDFLTAFFSVFIFSFLPFSIYFSRAILSDNMMVMAILGGTYFFDLAIKEKLSSAGWRIKFQIYFILAIVFTASAFLLKPFALFFTLSMFYIAYKNFGLSIVKKWQLWIFLIITLLPLVFWRYWMLQFPEGIPASDWLFNGGDVRFKGSFFYWIFADRIGRLIFGYFGLPLLFLGFLKKDGEKYFGFFLSFLVSILLYIFVIARGNLQHDYYQILIIPTLSIFAARGITFLFSFNLLANKIIGYLIVFTCFVMMFSFSWYHVRDFFNVNNWSMVKAGQKADKILPKDAKVIVPYDGDTSFLYQTNRKGWPAFEKSIDELIQMGASYLIISSPTPNDFSGFGKKYTQVASSPDYLILKLK